MFSHKSIKSAGNDEVTIFMVGDAGAGKSSFGNLYLEADAFEANDSAMPDTKNTVTRSNEVDGMKRWAIEAESLNDGNSINSIQIQNLAKLMMNYERGVNAIVIVLNGRCPRFSQGVKDIIKFSYNAFDTKEVLNHMCIVFTNCENTDFLNRNQKKIEYLKCIQNYLSEISSFPVEEIPEIPMFFVDCYPKESNTETPENMTQFHQWVCSRTPLGTKQFKKYAETELRTEMIEIRTRKFERKDACHHDAPGFFMRDAKRHTHYRIYLIERTEYRTITTDCDGEKTTSKWMLLPGNEKVIETDNGEEKGWTLPYEKEI
ncbi:hypothetical protein M9Y10_006620 [Tritrichomonas musculus]|uniref:AIG1-type G domain-containing protein n=1 Tax=Tritrichomonas musculus TaxID=1915356 RepID=A0ABR2JEV8_9EUKA